MMTLTVQVNTKFYEVNIDNPINIAIPLIFNGLQPNAFGVEKATAKVYQTENLIGDTRQGGSCNFEEYKLIPHCNGTHTECVGHLTDERVSIHNSLREVFIPATLITVESENASETADTYSVPINPNDKLITKNQLQNALKSSDDNCLQGLIIRTLPNDKGKKTKWYKDNNSPYFSLEAIKFIKEKNVRHLLVDLPSIDRADDSGKLANHRLFWNVEQGSFKLLKESFIKHTITEMIYVDDDIRDGSFALNLQIAPFMSDASPSRPLLFELSEKKTF